MIIEIENIIKIRNAPNELNDEFIKELTIVNPLYLDATAQGRSTRGISKFIHNYQMIYEGISIPRGCRKKLITRVKELELKHEIIDKRIKFEPIFNMDSSIIKYRTYQYPAVVKLVVAGEEGVLVAPAGSGKTIIGLSLIPMFGQPTFWLTHTNRLAKQTLERANQFLPGLKEEDKGFIGGGKWKLGRIFTIGMIQTLVRRPEDLAGLKDMFGMVILDEAHHCPASTFLKVINRLNPYYLYGLTATPYRRDQLERIMFQTLGEATSVISQVEVENAGGIVIPTVKYMTIYSKKVDDNNVARILKGNIINNKKRNHIIVGDVIREALTGNYCIVVSGRKAHCETLYDLILTGWKKTGIATGDYSKKYVDEQVRRFYDNEITVLVTTFELLGEGFDVDFLNRAFIATPFRAERKVEQLVGRVQRTEKGKIDAIVYDYLDINIGVFKSQFDSKYQRESRCKAYERLRMPIEPCGVRRI